MGPVGAFHAQQVPSTQPGFAGDSEPTAIGPLPAAPPQVAAGPGDITQVSGLPHASEPVAPANAALPQISEPADGPTQITLAPAFTDAAPQEASLDVTLVSDAAAPIDEDLPPAPEVAMPSGEVSFGETHPTITMPGGTDPARAMPGGTDPAIAMPDQAQAAEAARAALADSTSGMPPGAASTPATSETTVVSGASASAGQEAMLAGGVSEVDMSAAEESTAVVRNPLPSEGGQRAESTSVVKNPLRTRSQRKRAYVVGGVGGGVLLLIAILVVAFWGDKEEGKARAAGLTDAELEALVAGVDENSEDEPDLDEAEGEAEELGDAGEPEADGAEVTQGEEAVAEEDGDADSTADGELAGDAAEADALDGGDEEAAAIAADDAMKVKRKVKRKLNKKRKARVKPKKKRTGKKKSIDSLFE